MSRYSYDLREKVMLLLRQRVKTITELSQIFQISRGTIYSWKNKYNETGDFIAKKPGPDIGQLWAIKDLDKFKEYLEKKPDRTLKEIAQDWQVSIETARQSLIRIGYSYKKKPWLQRTR